MLIFRDAVERVRVARFLEACAAAAPVAADHDARVALLVDLGMLEAALADLRMPVADDAPGATADLRAASLATGRLLCGGSARDLQAALARLRERPLPLEVELRAPEGYAYYALDPSTYAAAARRFLAAAGPGRLVCIGLRGIGTSLAAVVAATLEAAGRTVESLTLRPRGHPFDRRPAATPALRRWLEARADATFLVVDEGPGLSGSSFCGTAAFLGGLGVPDARIAFFPSHQPDPGSFVSAEARDRWPRHAVWPAGEGPPPARGRDVSGGGWRSLFYAEGEPWPAVLPWQERRKFLMPGPRPVLHKFAGLGRFGERALARAGSLAAAGLAPKPQALRRGYLAQAFVPGVPLRRDGADGRFLRWAARYLGHLGASQVTGDAARPEALVPMAATNIQEALGIDAAAMLERHAAALPPAPAVALDGRVLPHEWLRTAGGFLKTDALDHHADHGYPGPADLAWDVAAVGVEFDLTPATRRDFAAAAATTLGDPMLPTRLPFYAAAYLAYRTGHAVFAAGSLGGSPDGARMRRAVARYGALLAAAVARLQAS